MEAKSLRIGNFVDFNGTIDEVKSIAIRVVEIGETSTRCDVKYLKGVPITGEFLEKLGFKYNGAMYSKPENCVVNPDFDWIGIYLKRHDDDIEFECPKNIHELQNLYYAITGEELTLKE